MFGCLGKVDGGREDDHMTRQGESRDIMALRSRQLSRASLYGSAHNSSLCLIVSIELEFMLPQETETTL